MSGTVSIFGLDLTRRASLLRSRVSACLPVHRVIWVAALGGMAPRSFVAVMARLVRAGRQARALGRVWTLMLTFRAA